jgi:hypothetical protein
VCRWAGVYRMTGVMLGNRMVAEDLLSLGMGRRVLGFGALRLGMDDVVLLLLWGLFCGLVYIGYFGGDNRFTSQYFSFVGIFRDFWFTFSEEGFCGFCVGYWGLPLGIFDVYRGYTFFVISGAPGACVWRRGNWVDSGSGPMVLFFPSLFGLFSFGFISTPFCKLESQRYNSLLISGRGDLG